MMISCYVSTVVEPGEVHVGAVLYCHIHHHQRKIEREREIERQGEIERLTRKENK